MIEDTKVFSSSLLLYIFLSHYLRLSRVSKARTNLLPQLCEPLSFSYRLLFYADWHNICKNYRKRDLGLDLTQQTGEKPSSVIV